MPEQSALLWPWKLDAFHAQLYSVIFLTPAAGALSLLRSATRIDWFTLGITQLIWGLLPIHALLIVDPSASRGLACAAAVALDRPARDDVGDGRRDAADDSERV